MPELLIGDWRVTDAMLRFWADDAAVARLKAALARQSEAVDA